MNVSEFTQAGLYDQIVFLASIIVLLVTLVLVLITKRKK